MTYARGEPYVACEDLFKIYKIADLEVVALRGLDLSVERREIVAIVREIYERIYRLGNADGSAHFRRVVQSLQPGLNPLTPRAAVDSPLEIAGAIQ